MRQGIFNQLFIFEMANNHCGDVGHGLKIIRAMKAVSKDYDFHFAFKFQYRDLDTFIHPDYQGRHDLKYIKRFSRTRLGDADFLKMLAEVRQQDFLAICTPFDEKSVDKIVEHGYDIIKIAGCSFTDWPLIEKVAHTDMPVIASTAAASLEEIDKFVSFFDHRGKTFCLMHCVGLYPTPPQALELNQLDLLKKRYPGVPVGFSTHEDPGNMDAVKIAVAKGAVVFERHVNVETKQYGINAYSSTPGQIRLWLSAVKDAFGMCGISGARHDISDKEKNDLRELKRGVFVRKPLNKGEKLCGENVFYAIPNREGQILANDMSKYTEYTAREAINGKAPCMSDDVDANHLRGKVVDIIKRLRPIIVCGNIKLPNRMELELSHHYGIERYFEYGAAILNLINREYCKKIIILLPGQRHPAHHHVKKEETFHVLYGGMTINLEGKEIFLDAGEILTVERNTKHSFFSEPGCIFEEVSTTSIKSDSYYEDEEVANNWKRKTELTFWSDWLEKEIIL